MAIVVSLTGESSALRKDLKNVADGVEEVGKRADDAGQKSGKLSGSLADMGKVASGFVIGSGLLALPGLLTGMAQGAAADEQATARADKALENWIMSMAEAGETAADYTTEIQDMKNSMDERIATGQKLAFSDDDVRDSMLSLLAATDDYGEASKRHAAAMDLARGANIPLAQATKMLGKMNEDNVEVFKKMGITLGENATEAEALAMVQAKFGGQADAYAKSTAGQFEIASIRMAEAKETLGAALMPVMAGFGTLLATVILPAIEGLVNNLGTILPILAPIAAGIVTVAAAIGVSMIPTLWAWVSAEVARAAATIAANLPLIALIATLGLLAAGVVLVIQHWDDITKKFPILGEAADAIKVKFDEFTAWISGTFVPAVRALYDGVASAVGDAIAFVRDHWDEIRAVIEPAVQVLGTIVETHFGIIRTVIETAINVVKGIIQTVMALIQGDWQGAWDGIKATLSAAWDGIKEAVQIAIDGLLTIVKTIGPLILEGLGNLGELLVSAGEDLINGLIAGIKAKAAEAVEEVKNLAGDMISGAKDKLKIWSPSRVFAEIGEQIPAGIIEGIEAGGPRATQEVVDWINGMADDARSAWWKANAEFAGDLADNGWSVEEDGSISGALGPEMGSVSTGFDGWLSNNGISRGNGATNKPTMGPVGGPGTQGSGWGYVSNGAGGFKLMPFPLSDGQTYWYFDTDGNWVSGVMHSEGGDSSSGLAGGAGFGSASSPGGGFGQGAYTPSGEAGATFTGSPTPGKKGGSVSGGSKSGGSSGGGGKVDEYEQKSLDLLTAIERRLASIQVDQERGLKQLDLRLAQPQVVELTIGGANASKFIAWLFDQFAQIQRRQGGLSGA